MSDAPTALAIGTGSSVTQGILKALAIAELPTRIVAACVTPYSAGLYTAERAYICPYAEDPAFLDWLTEVCQAEGVRAVLSGVEPVLATLSPAAEQLAERTGAVCVVSPPDTFEIGHDKLATCRWLADAGLPHPRFAAGDDEGAVAALAAECGYPLVAKPRRGRTARGVVIVPDGAALERLVGREDVLVQEHLDDAGGEYTVGCLCDREGRLRGSVAMRRELRLGTTGRGDAGRGLGPARPALKLPRRPRRARSAGRRAARSSANTARAGRGQRSGRPPRRRAPGASAAGPGGRAASRRESPSRSRAAPPVRRALAWPRAHPGGSCARGRSGLRRGGSAPGRRRSWR